MRGSLLGRAVMGLHVLFSQNSRKFVFTSPVVSVTPYSDEWVSTLTEACACGGTWKVSTAHDDGTTCIQSFYFVVACHRLSLV